MNMKPLQQAFPATSLVNVMFIIIQVLRAVDEAPTNEQHLAHSQSLNIQEQVQESGRSPAVRDRDSVVTCHMLQMLRHSSPQVTIGDHNEQGKVAASSR